MAGGKLCRAALLISSTHIYTSNVYYFITECYAVHHITYCSQTTSNLAWLLYNKRQRKVCHLRHTDCKWKPKAKPGVCPWIYNNGTLLQRRCLKINKRLSELMYIEWKESKSKLSTFTKRLYIENPKQLKYSFIRKLTTLFTAYWSCQLLHFKEKYTVAIFRSMHNS